MLPLILHLIGDYVLQTEQMALRKGNSWFWASFHALVYALPFLLIANTWAAWLIIFLPHLIVDRLRLANKFCRLKSYWWFGDRPEIDPCTGFSAGMPVHAHFWLTIIVDNTMHLSLNYIALEFLNTPHAGCFLMSSIF